MGGQKQEEIYQTLFRVWNFEYTITDLQEIPGKDCFLQDIRSLGKEIQDQLNNESTKIGQSLLHQTLNNIHYLVNDLLEVRTYKIMEAARSLKKLNESMLFDVELSYYRSLYTAFKGYSKIRNLIVDGQEIKDVHLTYFEQKESIPNSLILENNNTSQQIETQITTPEISNNSIQIDVKIEETNSKMDSPVIEQPKLEKTLKTERKYDGFYTLIRILKPIPALVGEDFEIYGPFQPEDITNLPNRNAQILIEEKMAKPMGETG